MVFTSLEFALFFGLVLILNWRLKNNSSLYPPFLLAANLIFYGLGAPKFVPLLLLVAALNWYVTALMYREHRPARRKIYICCNVVICIGILFFFKYFEFGLGLLESLGAAQGLLAGFRLPEIVYPIGLSFFTFQGLSLAIDHYRDPTLEPPDFISALIFVSFFPTVLSGPIQRADKFIPQLSSMKYDPESFNLAVVLILSGLFKKITLSSYVSEHIVRQVFQVPEAFSSLAVWAGIYGYGAQIYLDFSGYSDLALGIGLLLGYNVGVNFNSPYLATNIRDFWHRWHISLSTWLRDYLYIPLGGNRRGSKSVNLFLTQLLGGLWHGAHLRYVIWGAAHGLALVVSHFFNDRRRAAGETSVPGQKGQRKVGEALSPARKFLGFLLTFNFVSLCWILFRAEDASRAWEIVRAAFDFGRAGEGAPLLVWLVIVLTLLMQMAGGEIRALFLRVHNRLSGPVLAVWCAFWVVLILKLGPEGVLPFIYFQY